MSTALARRDETIDHLRNRLSRLQTNAKQEAQQLMRTGVGAGAAYGLGMAESKWGDDAVAGMSPSLAVGAVATAAAFLELGGPTAQPFLRGIGDAGVFVAAYKTGFRHQEARNAEGG